MAAVVALAHALGLRVVVEGVETAAQLERVTDLGCDFAQGYHLAPPLPAVVVEERYLGRASARLRVVS